ERRARNSHASLAYPCPYEHHSQAVPAEQRPPANSPAKLMGYVDLHSHVLPGIDDGARSADIGLAMLRALAGAGFDKVAATPHQKAGQFLAGWDEIGALHRDMSSRLRAGGIRIQLSLGAENFWDDVFYQRWRNGAIPSYDDGAAFLFEIPTAEVPAKL